MWFGNVQRGQDHGANGSLLKKRNAVFEGIFIKFPLAINYSIALGNENSTIKFTSANVPS